MIRSATDPIALLLLAGACSCAPQGLFLDKLESTVPGLASEYTGAIRVASGVPCFADPVAPDTTALTMTPPDSLVTVAELWMADDAPTLPVIGSGIVTDQEQLFYASFSHLVVDTSATLVCDGQPVSEALFAVGKMRSGLTDHFTVDEVEALVTEYQTATELPTVRLEALPFEPEEEP